MDFDANVEFLRVALWQVIMTAGPLLFVALIVGLIIGIIQAATSINEMTLSFVPKLVRETRDRGNETLTRDRASKFDSRTPPGQPPESNFDARSRESRFDARSRVKI